MFASCSCDGTIRLWNVRTKAAALQVKASSTDINMLSWNRVVHYLLASGANDGALCIWDLTLRNFTADSAVASLRWNQVAITSVECVSPARGFGCSLQRCRESADVVGYVSGA